MVELLKKSKTATAEDTFKVAEGPSGAGFAVGVSLDNERQSLRRLASKLGREDGTVTRAELEAAGFRVGGLVRRGAIIPANAPEQAPMTIDDAAKEILRGVKQQAAKIERVLMLAEDPDAFREIRQLAVEAADSAPALVAALRRQVRPDATCILTCARSRSAIGKELLREIVKSHGTEHAPDEVATAAVLKAGLPDDMRVNLLSIIGAKTEDAFNFLSQTAAESKDPAIRELARRVTWRIFHNTP
jgi:hypothetical protein